MAPPPSYIKGPDDCPDLFEGFPSPGDGIYFPPVFTQHFHARLAAGPVPAAGAKEADLWVWVRHEGRDEAGSVEGVVLEIQPNPGT